MSGHREAFRAIRRDPRWKQKLGIGVLIQLIPYVGVVWMLGWEMEYQRNVAWGDDANIPDWSDFSRQALLGLKAMVAVLPYSFVLTLAIVPLPFVSVAMMASSSPDVMWPAIAVLCGSMLLLPIIVTLLMLPLSGSATLRVALYGTIESGYQYKEILRLMRQHKPELMRAWGFSVLNTGISLAFTVVYLGALAGLMFMVPGSSEAKALVIVLLAVIGYFGYLILAMGLSLYLGLANMHHFGRYGRAAYGLDDVLHGTGLTSISTLTR